MRKNLFILIIASLISSGCGFKIDNPTSLSNFYISEIKTSGEKRINYKIKRKLSYFSKKVGKRSILVNLTTSKNKTVKERNKNNQITKYEISIVVNIEIKSLNQPKLTNFTITKVGDYNTAEQHSATLSKERVLTELLSENLAEEIFNEITRRVNDF